MSDYTHWFYVEDADDNGYRIITYAKGDHPVSRYWYRDLEELQGAIKRFESDGYKWMKGT